GTRALAHREPGCRRPDGGCLSTHAGRDLDCRREPRRNLAVGRLAARPSALGNRFAAHPDGLALPGVRGGSRIRLVDRRARAVDERPSEAVGPAHPEWGLASSGSRGVLHRSGPDSPIRALHGPPALEQAPGRARAPRTGARQAGKGALVLPILARTLRGLEWIGAAEVQARLGPPRIEHGHRELRFSVPELTEEVTTLGTGDDVFGVAATFG